jgi:hypothetical protein
MKPLWQTVERGAVQVEVGEAQEAHVGVEQDVQREEAETLLGSESGSRYSAKIFRTVCTRASRAPAALYTHGPQLVNGFACSSALPDGVAAGIAVASSTRVGATHGRGL